MPPNNSTAKVGLHPHMIGQVKVHKLLENLPFNLNIISISIRLMEGNRVLPYFIGNQNSSYCFHVVFKNYPGHNCPVPRGNLIVTVAA